MAKTFLGEISISIHNQYYTLRPSLGALHEIEQQTGMDIPSLIAAANQGRLTKTATRIIIETGLKAAGGRAVALPWEKMRFIALTFLMNGLGYRDGGTNAPEIFEENATAAVESRTPPLSGFAAPNWTDLYQTATVTLGRGEEEFWRMTMSGLMLQCAAHAKAKGLETSAGGPPATSGDLAVMMRQFPDRVAGQI